jgi:hypothetical protein
MTGGCGEVQVVRANDDGEKDPGAGDVGVVDF